MSEHCHDCKNDGKCDLQKTGCFACSYADGFRRKDEKVYKKMILVPLDYEQKKIIFNTDYMNCIDSTCKDCGSMFFILVSNNKISVNDSFYGICPYCGSREFEFEFR